MFGNLDDDYDDVDDDDYIGMTIMMMYNDDIEFIDVPFRKHRQVYWSRCNILEFLLLPLLGQA